VHSSLAIYYVTSVNQILWCPCTSQVQKGKSEGTKRATWPADLSSLGEKGEVYKQALLSLAALAHVVAVPPPPKGQQVQQDAQVHDQSWRDFNHIILGGKGMHNVFKVLATCKEGRMGQVDTEVGTPTYTVSQVAVFTLKVRKTMTRKWHV
jgi:hypothetical protein